MNYRFPTNFLRFAILTALSVLAIFSCKLDQTNVTEETVTFPGLYDSLKSFDRAVIVFTTENGVVIDTVFNSKVTSAAQLENLKVDNWDGGRVLITIIGINGDTVVYRVDKKYNGKTDNVDETFIRVTPLSTLSYPMKEIPMLEGDSLTLPAIIVKPAGLSDKTLTWTSSDNEVLVVGDTFIKAVKKGSVDLTITLKSDPTKSLVLKITVDINTKIPESLALSAETLYVATNGAPGKLLVAATPTSASNAVTWRIEDSTIATVTADGSVHGLKKGDTKLLATSKEKATIFASSIVDVTDPVPVAIVRFLKDSTDLFIRGAAEVLQVEVLPKRANPAVEFSVSDPLKLGLVNGSITGLAEGDASVYVASKENPLIKDTLRVHVQPSQIVDSVRLSAHALKLFTGGDSQVLTAKVMPVIASPKIQWTSSQPGVAVVDGFGKVSPVSAGLARIYALSLADSLKKDSTDVNVKVDAPQVSVGQDTVISLGQTLSFLPVVAPQEFGVVVQFKVDFDGNLTWDDSSAAVKTVSYKFDVEKEYSVRFYVRDTEGNQTIVVKKVRTVKGPVVNIVSPANNSYSRVAVIAVKWTVDNVEQDSLKSATLKDGANFITRMVKDAAGTPFSTSITVTLDSLAPNKPQVHGPALVAALQPTWTWATGGSGGNGLYRTALDAENFASAAEIKDTLFTPDKPLAEGFHTLFVQERDAAGNWSASGFLTLRIDVTAPTAPTVTLNTTPVSNNSKPVWSWVSSSAGPGGGSGAFQYKLDNTDFSSGATATTALTYSSLTPMPAGLHTLYVREKDTTGNWSLPGSASVTLDFDAPLAPKVVGSSPTSTNPKWSWSTGGNAGSGDYRFHLGSDPTAADAETRLLEYIYTGPVSGQTYTLYVQERDAAGNWSPSANLPIKYDLTKPTVTIALPQASGTFITNVDGTTAISVSGSAAPNPPNTITSVTYSLDGGAQQATVAGAGGAWSFNVTLPIEKTYTLKVTATDNLTNTGEATLLVLRDHTPPPAPKIETNPAATINTTSGTWTWSAVAEAATGSGLSGKFRYSLNGGTSWTETTALTVMVTPLKEGSQTFSLQEQDKANWWSTTSATNTVIVDTKGPVLAFTAPTTDGLTYTSTTTRNVAFKVTATDAGIGVKKVECTLSGATVPSHAVAA